MSGEDLYSTIWKRKLLAKDDSCRRDKCSRHAAAAELLKPAGRFLDIGCGDGLFAHSQSFKFKEVYGVDICRDALREAGAKGITICQADFDAETLPFKDSFLDTITCLDVIEHVIDPVRLIRECARVLVAGGCLIIATPNIRYLKHLSTLFFRGRFPRTSIDEEGYDGGHLHYFTFRDIEAILKGAGFRVNVRQGIVSERVFSFLRPFSRNFFVREFLSAAILMEARKDTL